ncbi:TetR/AcrR family transcriptional regulator [Paenarthrobacter aurescens]|uniref:TetR family transcriptional regulator n=1 Tax=Paenarthrobacter aurescens TaxID=43663 RepID=A0A4Y3NJX0_PAEAU|nr:TetR/AcrR family transcriptional regulator [Paenarthrobacter aurescens]MDO6142273.1 TetR/AcrR family transcriptional regulator [Paenarthrobacter aurescens]MDO6146121.1 TetR/AcrR family transcriptional regulator [Paenarthrobacter aurescens]MDO6157365.1 TetR/AcrR family transcriptional regulator [Paenarthrobacter aurescens]MDO6161350.1 TetR/AcrR family transcriptional regulator [Paenarthrobacter aurescens]GEB19009.1 TetR family transcriptional regulator [Paenarthrobacter aurescens]
MSTSKARGQYAKGAERREQIIQTATDVFATEGFEGTALKRVAELVGVKEATLFHYFKGKQELLTAVLAERDRRSLAVGGEAAAGLGLMPPIAERNVREPGLTTLYAVASATANDPGHASHSYFKERYEAVVRDTAVDIERRQKAGEVRTDVDAVMLARLTVAAFDGLQLQWLYDKNVDMADGLRQLIEVLLAPSASQQM